MPLALLTYVTQSGGITLYRNRSRRVQSPESAVTRGARRSRIGATRMLRVASRGEASAVARDAGGLSGVDRV